MARSYVKHSIYPWLLGRYLVAKRRGIYCMYLHTKVDEGVTCKRRDWATGVNKCYVQPLEILRENGEIVDKEIDELKNRKS